MPCWTMYGNFLTCWFQKLHMVLVVNVLLSLSLCIFFSWKDWDGYAWQCMYIWADKLPHATVNNECSNFPLVQHRDLILDALSLVFRRTNMCNCLVIDSPQAHQLTWGSRTSLCWWPWCSPTWSTRWTRPPPTSSSNPFSFSFGHAVIGAIGILATQDV